METVKRIIDEIASVSGVKEKKAVIKKYEDNALFSRVVKYALDQDKSYDLTDLPEPITDPDPVPLWAIFSMLDSMAEKKGTTMEEAQELSNACDSGPARDVVLKILKKDLRCGARAKVFNGVKKGWVYEVPYQRYKSFSNIHKIDFSRGAVVAQLKMDGQFAYLFTARGEDYFLSRNGSTFDLGPEFRRVIDNSWLPLVDATIGEPTVRMGELLVMGQDGRYLPRKEGNGIINSFISGKGSPERIKDIYYVTWGFITEKEYEAKVSKRSYQDTLLLDMQCASEGGQIKLSETTWVSSLEEAMEFYRAARKRNEEGAMVKEADKLFWKDQQSGTPYGVKLKPEAEAEFEIVEAYYGDKGKKWEKYLGGLVVKTSCGKLVSRLGSGFSDEERLLGVDWWNEHKGKIVTGRFTGITTDKTGRTTMCLDHGRFVETRFHDKTEADTFEYCMEEVKKA